MPPPPCETRTYPLGAFSASSLTRFAFGSSDSVGICAAALFGFPVGLMPCFCWYLRMSGSKWSACLTYRSRQDCHGWWTDHGHLFSSYTGDQASTKRDVEGRTLATKSWNTVLPLRPSLDGWCVARYLHRKVSCSLVNSTRML